MFSFLTALILTYLMLLPMRYVDKRNRTIKIKTMKNVRYYEKHDKWYYLWYSLAIVPIVFITAFRSHTVGYDNNHIYYDSFNNAVRGTDNEHFEIGFRLLVKVISFITANYQWFDIITSCLILIMIFQVIERDSDDVALSYLIFVISGIYIYSLSGIRQYLAIAVFMVGIKYIYEKKFVKYALFVIFASMFHAGILVTIVLYFLVNYKKQIITPKIMMIILGALFAFRGIVSLVITRILVGTRYYGYIMFTSDLVFQKFVLIIQVGILLIIMANYKMGKNDKKYMMAYWSQAITVATVIFTGIIPEISRVAWYFMAYQIVGIPIALSYERKSRRRIIYTLGIVAVYLVYFIYDFIYMKYYDAIPYSFCFWEKY